MSRTPRARRTRMLTQLGALTAVAALAVGCTSNTAEDSGDDGGSGSGDDGGSTAVSANDDPGETVVIGFSGPAADHGWLAAINSAAEAEADKYSDIEFRIAEGTNDPSMQISHVETFINEEVDAIVLLPTDGAALTEDAIQAMQAGIPVVNVDREFSSEFAVRVTILGDNSGIGVYAGPYA